MAAQDDKDSKRGVMDLDNAFLDKVMNKKCHQEAMNFLLDHFKPTAGPSKQSNSNEDESNAEEILNTQEKFKHKKDYMPPDYLDEPELYDDAEDDDNERWVEEYRLRCRRQQSVGLPSPNMKLGDMMSSTGLTSSRKRKQDDSPAPTKDSTPKTTKPLPSTSSENKEGSAKVEDKSKQEPPLNSKRNFKTDAVLNCPACFTLLCLESQRHDLYKTQYRAIFVTENCNVDLQTPLKEGDSAPSKDVYFPVRCSICSTQVAVYDTDQVYHFFNVISSH